MNEEQKRIHERALLAREQFHKFELGFIDILLDAKRTKLPEVLGKKNLHTYAVEILGFSDSVAYMFIAVAKKSVEVPLLLESKLSVFVLSRLLSTINPSNAADLIHIAQTKSSRELDMELGRRNPKYKPERTKILAEDCFELTVKTSAKFLEKLKRVQALRAQKNDEAGIGLALEASLDEYLRRFDPVQKAERALERKNKKAEFKMKNGPAQGNGSLQGNSSVRDNGFFREDGSAPPGAAGSEVEEERKFCAHRIFKRVPLNAKQRHFVFHRDQGKCTHLNADGERCNSDQWIQVHHILEVARGGGNEPENLTTVCSFHHDRIHQLSFDVSATG